MLSKHQKYFFLVSGFQLLIWKTYLIFKNRGKIDKNRLVCENVDLAPSGIWSPLRLIGLSCFLAISQDYRDPWTTRRDHL